jgi:hypothetical protein
MKLTYEQIKNKPKVLQSITTLRLEEFEKLSKWLDIAWHNYIQYDTMEGAPSKRKAAVRSDTVLRTAEDRFLFILYHLKGNVIVEKKSTTLSRTM